jgi:glycosyltransferase involved in cell wall biosynthesis
MHRRPAILLVTTGLSLGGAERQLVQMAIEMRKRDWPVRVVSMLPPVGFVDELSKHEIEVDSLGMRRGVANPIGLLRLARIIRSWRPAIVHSYMVGANLLCRLTRLLAPVPVQISTVQNTFEGGSRREFFYRLTDPLCTITTQVSQAGLERYVRVRAVPARRIEMIPNSVDLSQYRPDPKARARLRKELGCEDRFVWLSAGRLHEQKRYGLLLEAIALIPAQERERGVWLIAGDGPERADLAAATHRLGLEQVVRFLGHRHDLPQLLNAADGFVMSSIWEGTSLAVLEAAATCLPIVATRVGGNEDCVIEGVTGRIVEPEDAGSLSEAICWLMSRDPAEGQKMGEAAREHVAARYSLQAVADQWEELYGRLLEKRGIALELRDSSGLNS